MLRLRAGREASRVVAGDFPIQTQSICPECLGTLDGKIVERDGSVVLEKECAEHGRFEEVLSTDVEFFLRLHKLVFEDGEGVSNPQTESLAGCPKDCGLCDRHLSTPAMGIVDLTNRCNLNCPICFANANVAGYVYEVTVEQVCGMLDILAKLEPVPAACVQFSGGEPTLHPEFVRILAEAKARRFAQVQVASNGIRFAKEPDFTRQCADAGLNIVYLQFDGLSDEVYLKTRGKALADLKLRAVENIYAAGMRTCLVPTVVRGISDHEVGATLKYAIEHVKEITAISWQPVTFTGRIDVSERAARRFTLADLARELERQTGILKMHRDWYPLSFVTPFSRLVEASTGEAMLAITCHGHCGAGTFLVVNDASKEAIPLPAFFDCEKGMGAMDKMAKALARKGVMGRIALVRAFQSLEGCYRRAEAPAGWNFQEFLAFMNGFVDFRLKYHDNRARRTDVEARSWRALFLAGMHFQDSYTYELDRVRRCVIQYVAPNGRMYPFCSYNSGPCYRERIEKRYGRAHAERRERKAAVEAR
ncbi:MAG: radical SAM protein [Planctomycetota bacterium]